MITSIYIKCCVSQSVSLSVCPLLLVPRGTNIFPTQVGGQTFFVGGSGGFDDVDEEIDVSEANFLVSKANIFVREANIFVREASKLFAGARIFRANRALKF